MVCCLGLFLCSGSIFPPVSTRDLPRSQFLSHFSSHVFACHNLLSEIKITKFVSGKTFVFGRPPPSCFSKHLSPPTPFSDPVCFLVAGGFCFSRDFLIRNSFPPFTSVFFVSRTSFLLLLFGPSRRPFLPSRLW